MKNKVEDETFPYFSSVVNSTYLLLAFGSEYHPVGIVLVSLWTCYKYYHFHINFREKCQNVVRI